MNNLLIQQMQESHFYPHPVQTPIKLVQTHASYVFLTGDYAYKVKKSVDFGFFDYSTLDKRKHFLEEELRLNGEIAPDLYLEVLPIIQQEKQFILNAAGTPVEYVLKMRQFPQDCLLSEMLKQDQLTPEHIQELGEVVAKFHQKAKVSPEICSFGDWEQIKSALDNNYKQTAKYIDIVQPQKQYQETKEFSDTFFQEKQALFNQRQEKNFIRECHGDLHLRNICYWPNKIQLFDRIEFNKPFRFVDVMYDIAFAVMDLDAKKQTAFGNLFLNTYLEHTGDWEGVQLLPLYLSRQAYVRAKVTSFLLDDPQVAEKDKKEAAETAKDYYSLAHSYTQQKTGKIFLMSGISGTGKTTVGRAIAQHTQAIHIRSDAVRKHLAGISLHRKGTADLYSAEMSQKTYQRLWELGKMLVSQGFNVVLDGKYDRLKWRTPILEYAQTHQNPLKIVHCTAPMDLLCDRLNQRKGDISDATADLLSQQKSAQEDFQPNEQMYSVTVDTSQPWTVEPII